MWSSPILVTSRSIGVIGPARSRERMSCAASVGHGGDRLLIAESREHLAGELRNDAPGQHRRQADEIERGARRHGGARGIRREARPRRGVLQIGIGARPRSRAFPPRRGGTRAPRGARAAARRARRSRPPAPARARPVRRHPARGPRRPASVKRNARLTRLPNTSARSLFMSAAKRRDREVGVGGLGRVGDQPPAPEIGRQFLQRRVGEDAAPAAGGELAALRR